ncbi:MAG TPA: GspH/FimT family pseudopilin [Steroidobacter sp.]
MTAIVVLAILLGIGIPSLTAIMRQNRLAGQTNELIGALALARSEAVKRGTRVSICSANADGDDCSGETDWGNGWLLFTDSEGDQGEIDADGTEPDDTIIQVWPAPSLESINLTSSHASITFMSSGAAAVVTSFTVRPKNCSGAGNARRIDVALSGRASKANSNC